MREKEPLYRRVNTRTRGVRHGGGEYRWQRNARRAQTLDRIDAPLHAPVDAPSHGRMSRTRRGLDYTPLFAFLQSRVRRDWSATFGEALSRLDRPEPIFWLVARSDAEKKAIVRVGESTYYSGLYVDDDGRLARVDPALRLNDLEPSCACCTHTFNGVPFIRGYADSPES